MSRTQNPPKKPLSLRNHPNTKLSINQSSEFLKKQEDHKRRIGFRSAKEIHQSNFGLPLFAQRFACTSSSSRSFHGFAFSITFTSNHRFHTQSIDPQISLYRFAAETTMSALFDGIPEAVALRCLARVPLDTHPNLELVSRSWRTAIRSDELFKVRKEVGSVENLLCVCAFDPENIWQVYSPNCDRWLTLPLLPSRIRHLAHFGAVTVAGKLFVLGGGSDAVDPLTGDHDGTFATDEVWSYDFVHRQWTQRAPMLVPRAMFACCVLDGNIVVAGGFTTCRKSISGAEMYDPENDVWTSIPDLHRTHNSACSGLVVKGKVHVLHKGLSTVQVLESVKLGWAVKEYGWPQGPMAVVEDVLYVMSHGLVLKQEEDDTWKMVASASEFKRRIGMAVTSLSDEVLIVGGVIGPDRLNWDIKPLSDVDALTVGSDRLAWRKVAPMTRCRGTILGCTQLTI